MNPLDLTCIDQLTTDELREVIQYLPGESIHRLFLCGSLLLCKKLCSHRVVLSLNYNSIYAVLMPNLSSLRCFGELERLKIEANPSYDSLAFINQASLSCLPKSITEIDFRFANADKCWVSSGYDSSHSESQCPPFDFKLHFPNLRSFRIQHLLRFMSENASICLSSLPPSLTALSMPNCHELLAHNISHLVALEELHMPLVTNGKAMMEVLSTFPLRTLVLSAIAWHHDFEVIFPMTLEHLSLHYEWSNVPWLAKLPRTLKSLWAVSFLLQHADEAAQLPPNLQSLTVAEVHVPMTTLPRTLTVLKFNLSPAAPLAVQRSFPELPSGLLELQIPGTQNLMPEYMKWPSTLTSLGITSIPFRGSNHVFPPFLTSLTLSTRHPDLSQLPSSITIVEFTHRPFERHYRLPAHLAILAAPFEKVPKNRKRRAKQSTSSNSTSDNSIEEPEDAIWISAKTASKHGLLEILKWIKQIPGAQKEFEKESPLASCLSLAAKHDHLEVTKWLLSIGVHWAFHKSGCLPAALLASIDSEFPNHSRVLTHFLSMSPILKLPNLSQLWTHAMKANHIEALRLLHQNKVEFHESSLLLIACNANAKIETFQFLLEELHVDPNATDTPQNTPMILLAKHGSLQHAQLLHAHGGKTDVVDHNGCNLAHLAVTRQYSVLPWIKWLDSLGLDLNCMSQRNDPKTPLMIAQIHNDLQVMNYLQDWCRRSHENSIGNTLVETSPP